MEEYLQALFYLWYTGWFCGSVAIGEHKLLEKLFMIGFVLIGGNRGV